MGCALGTRERTGDQCTDIVPSTPSPRPSAHRGPTQPGASFPEDIPSKRRRTGAKDLAGENEKEEKVGERQAREGKRGEQRPRPGERRRGAGALSARCGQMSRTRS